MSAGRVLPRCCGHGPLPYADACSRSGAFLRRCRLRPRQRPDCLRYIIALGYGYPNRKRQSGDPAASRFRTEIPGWRRFLIGPVRTRLTMAGASTCAFSRGNLGGYVGHQRGPDGRSTNCRSARSAGQCSRVFYYYGYSLKYDTILVFSRVNIASDGLYVFFNQEGVVEHVLMSERTNKLKFRFWPFGG